MVGKNYSIFFNTSKISTTQPPALKEDSKATVDTCMTNTSTSLKSIGYSSLLVFHHAKTSNVCYLAFKSFNAVFARYLSIHFDSSISRPLDSLSYRKLSGSSSM